MEHNTRRIILNVQGCRFETFQATLDEFPDTLLGSEEKRSRFYDPLRDEYFFERDKYAFDSILFYYQSRGILSCPPTISQNTFDEELKFYEIRPKEPEQQETRVSVMPLKKWQRKMWKLLEYPESSKQAAFFSKLSMLVIVLSVIAFCAETLDKASTRSSISSSLLNNTNNETAKIDQSQMNMKRSRVWFIIDTCIIIWFSMEYLSRLASSPDKVKFIRSMLAIIDLLAIIPYFLSLILGDSFAPAFSFTIMRVFRLLRVVRLLKLTRYVAALRILGQTVQSCQEQLTALMFLILISVILFSSAIFYIEKEANPENFSSIPASFWWTIITMTTVGYGDMTPQTPQGRVVGAVCAVFGVVVMVCLPSPVFISSFNEIYVRYITTLKKNQKNTSKESSSETWTKWRKALTPSKMMIVTRQKPNTINDKT